MVPSIDWKSLGFKYAQTDCYVRVDYKNEKWGDIQVCTDPLISLHAAATCLQYGQACFEGMKAFTQKDGSIAVFRPEENARRMMRTADRVLMIAPPEEIFVAAVKKAVELNKDWVPPYGTGASMYIRPFLIGTSAHVGVHPSEEYAFIVMVMPVGPYYKHGFAPVKAYIQEEYDRAAPRGVGNVKVGGNYAAGMRGDFDGKAKGFPICLYLDSATHKYIDEFGTSNFFGITKDKKYVTPESNSILPSITNLSLMTIAEDLGMKVERRHIAVTELADFVEIGACGTAAVITPVYSVLHGTHLYTFGKENEAGKTLLQLFEQIQGIQYGDIADTHNWMSKVL